MKRRAVTHEHTGTTPDNDVCTTCWEIVCPDCGAVVGYDSGSDTYTHPAPLCWLHHNLGSIEGVIG